MVDRDRSGFIDENELQQAISSGYQRFSIRTIRLLMFLFKNPHDPLRFGWSLFPFLYFVRQFESLSVYGSIGC
jgi:calcium-binding protein CML